ncbi:Putative Zn-dependent protease [Faunimonas pinastri]|uniref:Putative Zn-dependent protease n=1 Tax=Faunimonas pinastri TaxID=1855383 RepID=A0A1H9MJ02_9HYPH|nr:M48 family metalloprotease [Faunimonas pinastri]SER23437.1 Putative Zn-dependent protease [Faunimonas pinastri]
MISFVNLCNPTFMRTRLFIPVLALALAGCQMAGSPSPKLDVNLITSKPLSAPVVKAAAPQIDPRIAAEYGGVYSDAKVEAAINGIVAKLVAASDDPTRRYKVTVLNSPVANAFAMPGGYLYVTRGLLALTENSSEFAAVVAHEMAHVLANHALARAKAIQQAKLVQQVAADVITDPSESVNTRTKSQLTIAKFSRDQEIEADRIGITMAGRAGYDPFAASRFMDKLQAYSDLRSALGKKDDAENFLASHPGTAERRELAVQVARQFGAPGTIQPPRDDYVDSLDGMIFGDDPSEGFVRGHEFLHPRLSIAFRVPSTFRLENTREAVLAASGDNTAMRFDGVSSAADMSPADYLASGWVNGLVPDSIKSETVNGLPAATAAASASNWEFRIGAVRVGSNMYRMIFADRGDATKIEQALQDTLSTFRRLDPSELTRLQPLRLAIVRVRSGDTVASMAARMQGTETPLELFRVINGFSDNQDLTAGQKVKLVID